MYGLAWREARKRGRQVEDVEALRRDSSRAVRVL